jgi:hypothetical protein
MAQESRIELPYRFEPWPHQAQIFTAFYDHGIRRFCEIWHRRSGKDKTFLNLLVDQMSRRVGNYCHVFPQRQRARRIVWQGIDTDGLRYIDHFPPALVYRKSEVEMSISLRHPQDQTREGSIYWCLGSDRDIHLLVGTNPIGVIWSEFAEINPRMRELVLPILRRNGGWEAIVTTPRGRNHAYRLYNQVRHDPDWHTSFLPFDATTDHAGVPLVTQADIDADLRAGMQPETAEQEYGLSWDTPMPGAYYAEEFRRLDREGRIRHVPYDPSLPTYTAWDLGINDCNAIWFFQPAGREVRFIDYLEGSSIPLAPPELPQAGDDLEHNWLAKVRQKPYLYDHSKLMPPLTHESYEVHYGPHDLEVTEYSSGKTRYSIALTHPLHAVRLRFTVLPRGPIQDGIEAARQLLTRAVFDETRCERGLDSLRSYRRQFDELRQVFVDHPYHNHASNAADSFRYAAVGLRPSGQPAPPPEPPGSFAFWRKQARKARDGRAPSTFRR